MSLTDAEKNRLKKVGLSGLNKPKRTPSHPKKSHAVLAKEGTKVKLIRFGQQGVKLLVNQRKENRQDKQLEENHLKLDMVET